MKLIDFLNGSIVVRDEVYTLTPFKKLYNSRKDKNLLIKEITWVWHMESFFSDFENIKDESTRSRKIGEYIGLLEGWKEDKTLRECRLFFREFDQDDIVKLAKANRAMARKMAEFMDKVDIVDVDELKKMATPQTLLQGGLALLGG